jgi:hypothetical protein
VPSLYDLAERLQSFVAGTIERDALVTWAAPVLAADPLDVEESDAVPWEDAPDEERLFWRLLYLVEMDDAPDDALRELFARVLACLADTASAAGTLELLPLLVDQPRLCAILARYEAGVISRTGLLGVIANSGYPAHVKLWLQHADHAALRELADALTSGAYARAAQRVERAP